MGVEGVGREILTELLLPFADMGACQEKPEENKVTKLDFYNAGLSGGEGSKEMRDRLARSLGLPTNMSANALIEAINLMSGRDEYEDALAKISPRPHVCE